MSGKIASSTLILLSLMFATAMAVSASGSGVSVGNAFTYSMTTGWSSNDPYATPPSDLIDQNNTQWFRLNVTGVSGTNVTAQSTTHFKNNGTETTVSNWIDVATGSADTPAGTGLSGFFISANLTVGNSVYGGSQFSQVTINESVSRGYPSSARDTNHLNVTYPSGQNTNTTINNYWDKLTGVLVEALTENVTQTDTYATRSSVHLQMYDSNVWTVPEFPNWTPALLMLAALTHVILMLSKRKLKKAIR